MINYTSWLIILLNMKAVRPMSSEDFYLQSTIVEWYFLEENTVNGLLLAMVGNWVTG
jgi:hypothetical protein